MAQAQSENAEISPRVTISRAQVQQVITKGNVCNMLQKNSILTMLTIALE